MKNLPPSMVAIFSAQLFCAGATGAAGATLATGGGAATDEALGASPFPRPIRKKPAPATAMPPTMAPTMTPLEVRGAEGVGYVAVTLARVAVLPVDTAM